MVKGKVKFKKDFKEKTLCNMEKKLGKKPHPKDKCNKSNSLNNNKAKKSTIKLTSKLVIKKIFKRTKKSYKWRWAIGIIVKEWNNKTWPKSSQMKSNDKAEMKDKFFPSFTELPTFQTYPHWPWATVSNTVLPKGTLSSKWAKDTSWQ